jgi:hypothetical protein
LQWRLGSWNAESDTEVCEMVAAEVTSIIEHSYSSRGLLPNSKSCTTFSIALIFIVFENKSPSSISCLVAFTAVLISLTKTKIVVNENTLESLTKTKIETKIPVHAKTF